MILDLIILSVPRPDVIMPCSFFLSYRECTDLMELCCDIRSYYTEGAKT